MRMVPGRPRARRRTPSRRVTGSGACVGGRGARSRRGVSAGRRRGARPPDRRGPQSRRSRAPGSTRQRGLEPCWRGRVRESGSTLASPFVCHAGGSPGSCLIARCAMSRDSSCGSAEHDRHPGFDLGRVDRRDEGQRPHREARLHAARFERLEAHPHQERAPEQHGKGQQDGDGESGDREPEPRSPHRRVASSGRRSGPGREPEPPARAVRLRHLGVGGIGGVAIGHERPSGRSPDPHRPGTASAESSPGRRGRPPRCYRCPGRYRQSKLMNRHRQDTGQLTGRIVPHVASPLSASSPVHAWSTSVSSIALTSRCAAFWAPSFLMQKDAWPTLFGFMSVSVNNGVVRLSTNVPQTPTPPENAYPAPSLMSIDDGRSSEVAVFVPSSRCRSGRRTVRSLRPDRSGRPAP